MSIRRKLFVFGLMISLGGVAQAAEVQGVITDWNCTQRMVKDGRENVLRQDRSCSLMKNPKRDAYGIITSDSKYYRLDDPGNQHILQLLENTPAKDNLKVVVSGEIQGDTLKVSNITIL